MSSAPQVFHIRPAGIQDARTIADFNCQLALETEDKVLDAATVRRGVERLLTDPTRGRYFVAEHNGQIVGQLMHTSEWSDWRNGDIWWIQSVYVRQDCRRSGVFRTLYHHLESLARQSPDVVGIRLYVERENQRAQQTYSSVGFVVPGYQVMERLFGSGESGRTDT